MASSEILVYVFPILITLCSYLIVSGGSQHLSNTAKSSLDEGLKKHLITPFYSPSNVSLKNNVVRRGKTYYLCCHLTVTNIIKYIHKRANRNFSGQPMYLGMKTLR